MAKLSRTDPIVQEKIRELAKTEASSTDIYKKHLPEYFGQSFRKKEVLADIRRYREVERKVDPIKSIPKKYALLEEKDIKKRLLNYGGKYNHIVSYQVKYLSGESYTEHITISTDKKYTTKTQILEIAKTLVQKFGTGENEYRGLSILKTDDDSVPYIDMKSIKYVETIVRIDDKTDL